MDIDTREQAIDAVLSGLQFLILHSATCAAREQYMPNLHSDQSDDLIGSQKKLLETVRRIRLDFENEVTGVL